MHVTHHQHCSQKTQKTQLTDDDGAEQGLYNSTILEFQMLTGGFVFL